MQRVTTADITSGKARLPFTSRSKWLGIQADCQDLRRTHSHLIQGTRPSKKVTNAKDVKRYLNVPTIARDGLLVVKRNDSLSPTRECIIVPRKVLDGLVTALHIQPDHPSSYQLKQIMHRYMFALDLDKSVETTSCSCHHCASLRNTPNLPSTQSTADPPEVVGISYAADIVKRDRQLILVLRECVTSYTVTCFVNDERCNTLRDSLIQLCIGLRPLDGPPAVIRTDPAPGFAALVSDTLLNKYRLTIELGRVNNINKNPVAKKAIRELEGEILHQQPSGGAITQVLLSIATANINARVRNRGMSARELWTQRDQFTNKQLPLNDYRIIREQHELRNANHEQSQQSKSPRGRGSVHTQQHIDTGDIVYLYSDQSKLRSRCRYLVVSTEGDWLNISKFTGTQLRATSYRVKRTECYKVLSETGHDLPVSYEYDDATDNTALPEASPDVPVQLTYPPPTVELPPREPYQAETATPALDYEPAVSSELDEPDRPADEPARRSTRARRPPEYLKDFVTQ